MKRLVLFIVLTFPGKFLIGQIHLVNSNQQWVHDFSQIKFSENLSVTFDASLRWKNNFFYFNQYLTRLSVNYRISKSLKLGSGISYSGVYSNGIFKTAEHRIHQDLQYEAKKEKFNFNSRLRIEERFFTDHLSDNQLQKRFYLRTRVSTGFEFKICYLNRKNNNAQLWYYFGEEFFFNLNKIGKADAFDQNRILTGPVFKFKDKLSIQLLYNFQIINSGIENQLNMNHIAWLIFRQTISWKHDPNP
jgi:hypothetical protein